MGRGLCSGLPTQTQLCMNARPARRLSSKLSSLAERAGHAFSSIRQISAAKITVLSLPQERLAAIRFPRLSEAVTVWFLDRKEAQD